MMAWVETSRGKFSCYSPILQCQFELVNIGSSPVLCLSVHATEILMSSMSKFPIP
jgi:hypothetical protein